eukprot:m.87261 g.87261  ORF g.87261 m.87261 type:complete len:164 (+) comp14902_c1_seq2:406-897(+)
MSIAGPWALLVLPTENGFSYLYHPTHKTILELCHGSNGWFRFRPLPGTGDPLICWSQGNFGHQKFALDESRINDSADYVDAEQLAEGAVEDLGDWVVVVDEDKLVCTNSNTRIELTHAGFLCTRGRSRDHYAVHEGNLHNDLTQDQLAEFRDTLPIKSAAKLC